VAKAPPAPRRGAARSKPAEAAATPGSAKTSKTAKPAKKAAKPMKKSAKTAKPAKTRAAGSTPARSSAESIDWTRAPGRRWWPRYDSQRPHVRLGILWFVVALGFVGGGPLIFAVPYAAAAALGAAQAARAWRRVGHRPSVPVAAAAAAAAPFAAAVTPRGAGIAVLAGTAASVLLAGGRTGVFLRDAGCTIRCWLLLGVAAACVVSIARADLGAAFAFVLLASAYDCGDYLVGVDARWPIVGTLAGMAAVGVLSYSLFVVALPPFGGVAVFVFGAALAVLAPLGQIAGSWVLPDGRALASGVRRLDAVLLAAPAWLVLLESYPLD
jgi:hypothetical protein